VDEGGHLRIGELSRRTGVTVELLRAWERRYGLLAPARTSRGYRLYSDVDVQRIARMRELLSSGLSAAEAARVAIASPARPAAAAAPEEAGADLRAALDRLDDAAAQAAFDRLLAEFSVGSVLENVVLPVLRDLGEGWARGEVSVAQEHFASSVVRGRLLGLARGWDRGSGFRAVLACPSGERHDLGLLAFGLALREQGWRITFLGGDTPGDTLAGTVADLGPAAVVLAVADAALLEASADSLRELVGRTTVWIGGAGARAELVARAGARLLEGSPVEAAERVARA
jgi:DNA-binding transcriptional MerR regulator